MALDLGKLLIIASLAAFAGCATPPEGPAYPEAKASAVKPGHALLYVFREYAEPTGFAAKIYVDGQEITSLSQGGFTWVYAQPGMRRITSTWAGSQDPGAIAVNLGQDKTYYLEVKGRAKSTMHGMVGIVPIVSLQMGSGFVLTDPESSEVRLAKCCRFQKPLREEY
ncbi:MAG TPA: DUF2846 domain-containing protein [Burkholderiales bacterium]|nr:DUF2846 domain-containing protein [Burkholderiales bacterium]